MTFGRPRLNGDDFVIRSYSRIYIYDIKLYRENCIVDYYAKKRCNGIFDDINADAARYNKFEYRLSRRECYERSCSIIKMSMKDECKAGEKKKNYEYFNTFSLTTVCTWYSYFENLFTFRTSNCDLSKWFFAGSPEPRVRWLMNSRIVDEEYEVNAGDVIENKLTWSGVTRKDLNAAFTCQATNTKLTDPQESNVILDMRRE